MGRIVSQADCMAQRFCCTLYYLLQNSFLEPEAAKVYKKATSRRLGEQRPPARNLATIVSVTWQAPLSPLSGDAVGTLQGFTVSTSALRLADTVSMDERRSPQNFSLGSRKASNV